VSGRGVVDVVQEIQQVVQPLVAEFPSGYFVEYSGQFQSQQTATRALLLLFGLSLLGVFLLLYSMFRSVNLALQVMAALPMAFIGSVVALVITGQSVTIAAMVGFISLGGIASRNGILLLNHYLHLVREEGEQLDQNMIVRAGLERLAPVLMTALTAAIGLLPLTMSAGQPGREILYPVATVIVGGVISSTLLDFLVHPALFWLFGLQSAAAVTADSAAGVQLTDES
jgi:HME family heavy-metal exporter